MVKKINEPCRAFSTTGSSLSPLPKKAQTRSIIGAEGRFSVQELTYLQVPVSKDQNVGIFMTRPK